MAALAASASASAARRPSRLARRLRGGPTNDRHRRGRHHRNGRRRRQPRVWLRQALALLTRPALAAAFGGAAVAIATGAADAASCRSRCLAPVAVSMGPWRRWFALEDLMRAVCCPFGRSSDRPASAAGTGIGGAALRWWRRAHRELRRVRERLLHNIHQRLRQERLRRQSRQCFRYRSAVAPISGTCPDIMMTGMRGRKGIREQALADFVAVEVRQAVIEQHQIGTDRRDPLDALGAIRAVVISSVGSAAARLSSTNTSSISVSSITTIFLPPPSRRDCSRALVRGRVVRSGARIRREHRRARSATCLRPSAPRVGGVSAV